MVTMVSVRTKVCVAVLACTWVWLIMSCQKTTILDTASLNIQVAEAQYISNGAKVAAANLIPNSTREVEIQWEGEYTLGIKITSSAEGAKGKVAQVSSPTGLKRQTLERDVQYRLLIFDKTDKLLASKDYRCGNNLPFDVPFSTQETYSFIVYSFGKKRGFATFECTSGS